MITLNVVFAVSYVEMIFRKDVWQLFASRKIVYVMVILHITKRLTLVTQDFKRNSIEYTKENSLNLTTFNYLKRFLLIS